MKNTFALILAFLLLTGTSYAETKNVDKWLKTFGHKLGISAAKRKKPTTTSTAGIKGAEVESGEDLYWKKAGINDEESDALGAALAHVRNGREAEATRALKEFIEKYPQSPFADDAREGLAVLGGED